VPRAVSFLPLATTIEKLNNDYDHLSFFIELLTNGSNYPNVKVYNSVYSVKP
jgi:hypothetical protein